MRWNPWVAAAEREDLVIEFAPVPTGAAWYREHDRDVIVIDEKADRRRRRALLAHELIHVERGVGHPVATAATMEREEAIVRRETARRLVPPSELARFVHERSQVEHVTPAVVADEFDVPEEVAVEAMTAVRGCNGARNESVPGRSGPPAEPPTGRGRRRG